MVLPRLDPRRENYAQFRGAYDLLSASIMLFILGMHFLLLAAATATARHQPGTARATSDSTLR